MQNPKNSMQVSELSKNIGKKAIYKTSNGLNFEVIVKDVEVFYGMPYYMVAPVAGSGLARVRDHLNILDGSEQV